MRDTFDSAASGALSFRSDDWYSINLPLPAFAGDEIVKNVVKERVAIIKVDVEGMQTSVLSGLKETIKRDSPIIICQVLPSLFQIKQYAKPLAPFAEDIEKLNQLLKNHKYNLFHVDDNSKIEKLSDLTIPETTEQRNYFFVHDSDMTKLKQLL